VRTGEGIGGFLNATSGNAAELIIAIAALHAGLHDVVKASVAGSIVGNVLLVLGAAMLAGGLRHRPDSRADGSALRLLRDLVVRLRARERLRLFEPLLERADRPAEALAQLG
jgi:calcium/proton exchanger cax